MRVDLYLMVRNKQSDEFRYLGIHFHSGFFGHPVRPLSDAASDGRFHLAVDIVQTSLVEFISRDQPQGAQDAQNGEHAARHFSASLEIDLMGPNVVLNAFRTGELLLQLVILTLLACQFRCQSLDFTLRIFRLTVGHLGLFDDGAQSRLTRGAPASSAGISGTLDPTPGG